MIREEADRLIEMTGKILENSEQDYGNRHMERRAVRFQRIVDSCKKALEVHLEEKDMQLSVVIPQDLPEALADPGMIRQVLINLISNAVKFSKSGQTVSVEAKGPHVSSLTLSRPHCSACTTTHVFAASIPGELVRRGPSTSVI